MSWWNPFSWFKAEPAMVTDTRIPMKMQAHPVSVNPSADAKATRLYGRLYRVIVAIDSGDTRQALKEEKYNLEHALAARGLDVPENATEAETFAQDSTPG